MYLSVMQLVGLCFNFPPTHSIEAHSPLRDDEDDDDDDDDDDDGDYDDDDDDKWQLKSNFENSKRFTN